MQQHRAGPVQEDRPRVRLSDGGSGDGQLPICSGSGKRQKDKSHHMKDLILSLPRLLGQLQLFLWRRQTVARCL